MATVTAYTSSGAKSSTKVTLDKSIFGVTVENHDLLKSAYVAYLANGRKNLAKTLKRGEVRGGGAKPWRQKGTGRARHGSRRSPIWTGGGVTFGPTGNENYTHKLNTKSKRQALRQALSTAANEGKISVIETFSCKDGKVKPTIQLLKKVGAKKKVVIVVSTKDALVERATSNIQDVKAVQASYLNVFDILNADTILVSKKSIDIIKDWLGDK